MFGTFCGSQSTIVWTEGGWKRDYGERRKKPSLRHDTSHPTNLRSMTVMGIMLCFIFWWHGWNAVVSYLGHNSAKLKNKRAQIHRKIQGCTKKKKKTKRRRKKCIFCCFKTIAKIWLNCALLWKGAKYSWGFVLLRG